MKVVFNCHVPFPLVHGGAQVQVERTKAALESLGVETDYLRWWDEGQTGDILHHLGAIPPEMIEQAHSQGWKVVNNILLSETCNRSDRELRLRRLLIRLALALPLPRGIQLPWRTFRLVDQVVVCLEAERRVLLDVYGVEPRLVKAVPLGLTDPFLRAGPGPRSESHLICHGTITPVKRSLELARWARAAQVPILFVGKPFDDASPYWAEFRQLVDERIVKHHPHVSSLDEMIRLLQRARGFVLLSRFENWSLAAHEAAACGLPLLLSDQRWAHERFGSHATYLSAGDDAGAAATLRQFYDRCPSLLSPGVRLYSWKEVAEILRGIYAQLLAPNTPR